MSATRVMGRLRSQDGTALVVAMGAMSVILLLSAWAAGASTSLSGSSERDRASKRALPATEAGLRQASYKLNNLKPLPTECPAGFTADGTLCRGSANATTKIDGGNGVLYDYWLTKSSPAGKCAGFPVGTDTQLEVRCVTAEATVNGVARRSQARLVRPTVLFPFPGLFGDRYVKLRNDSTINGALGSNDLIDLSNSVCIRDGRKIGRPGGRLVGSNPQSGANCSSAVTYNTAAQGPFVIAPVDFASTHLPANNQNGNWSGTHTWNATTRNLRITGSSFTFNGGTYNLCSLYIEGGTIYIPSGATVKIYLDSRPESGCTGGGSLIGNNNVTFTNPNSADRLQIFLNGPGPVEFNNQLTMNGYIHAPNAPVLFKNDSTVTGGIASQSLEALGKLNFSTPMCGGVACPPPTGVTESVFYRTAWIECSATRTVANDPMSGC